MCAHCGVFPNQYADVVAKAYQGGESEGSQNSQGSRRAPRKSQRNRIAALRFLDRLRFELLQGGGGGDRDEDGNDGDGDGGRSEDEEMPDCTTEPGPSEQPPETGHPNDGSQADDEFTEDEAPRSPAAEEAGAV